MATKKKSTTQVAAPAGSDSPFQAEAEKFTKLISAAAANEKVPSNVGKYVGMAAPFIGKFIAALVIAWPIIVDYTTKAKAFYNTLPQDVIKLIVGAICCFFGGMFPATIAAVEAWRLCGGKQALENVNILLDEAKLVGAAEAELNKRDADGDGTPDVQQMDKGQLLKETVKAAAGAVHPDKVNLALGGLYTGWIGVVSVLKIQFAKTVTLGAKIGDQIEKPATRYLAPILKSAAGDGNEKWVPVILNWICRAFAISIAWWLTRVISGFHSAIRGGHVMAVAIFKLLSAKGIFTVDTDNSYLDEIVGWAIAFVGFLFQWNCGFTVPTLFSLFLFPVQFLESIISWQVSS